MADSLEQLQRDVRFWQRLLLFAGFSPGKVDGISGPNTRAAASRWLAEARSIQEELGSFDERSERLIATLLPQAQRAARQWLSLAHAEASQRGYEVKIICGTRTWAEQDALARKTPRVTRAKGGQSFHNFGIAWDFGVFRGKIYYGEHELYRTLGGLSSHLKEVEWGGSWKSFVDEPHLQLRSFGSLAELRRRFGP